MNFTKGIGLIMTGIASILFHTALKAQSDNRISCVALVRTDSIVLRWAPSSLPVWQSGAKYGYNVTRYTISRNGIFIDDGLSRGDILNNSPVRPLSREYFDNLSSNIKEAQVVQEALYGEAASLTSGVNDFGSFMKAYEDNEVRLGFALFMCDIYPSLAKAAGLQFVDHNVIPGDRYAYSITPALTPEGMEVEQGIVIADAGEPTVLEPIIDVRAIFNDRIVRIQWPVIHLKGIYSAYLPERSFDGKNFKTASELPLVNLSENENEDYYLFTDSLDDNDTKIWYRIVGISPFGLKGPPSEVLSGKGIADFSAYSSIDSGWVEDGKNVLLKWRVTENPDSPVKGIYVLKSDNNDGPFTPVSRKMLSPRERTFTDNTPGKSNYYQLMLTGEGALRSYSFPYLVQKEDDDPPVPPEMLSGKVDSSGLVTIIWKKNEEPDLLGYKIFRANSASEEFVPLEQGIITENICHDSINLNTLTQKICYQVVAIDRNYNNSEYSKILELTRPDTIAPAPAVIKGISALAGKITIIQEESPSADVGHYELFRQEENDSLRYLAASWNKLLPSEFLDTPGIHGYVDYILVTFDNAGNSSENKRKVYVRDEEISTLRLDGKQSEDGKTISLRWQVPPGFTPSKTVIYRGTGENQPSLYKTTAGDSMVFSDTGVEINTIYSYMVLIYNSGNNESICSGKLILEPVIKSTRK